MTIRFHTCLILIKDIERIVKDATNVWKGIYHLHKPSDHPVEIKDDDDDEDYEEGKNSITMDVIDEDLQELMKEKEEEEEVEEAVEEDKEEDDPVKIAAAVIASLPHSPPKPITSTMETTSTSEIVSTSATSIAQSSLAPSQL